MDVKNIKGNDPKMWSKPYDRPKDEGAYESAPKYENDNDDDEILFFSVVMKAMDSHMVLMIVTTTAVVSRSRMPPK
jgi:hypothetical protein